MERRQLGNSEMQITPIGLGAWAIGGVGWGAQEDRDSVAAIQRALDLGINWIDTAAVYGYGHSEALVARALKGRSAQPYVFTKCGLVWNDAGEVRNHLKADSIRREVEDSLTRLQREVLDLYQIHWPYPDEDIEEAWGTLADLKNEGKVRYIGVSNFSVEQMQRAMRIAPITSLQPPYSLLRREIEEEILPFCQQHNIGVIVYSPMQSGLLTGAMTRERIANLPQDDWRTGSRFFKEPILSHALEYVERMRAVGENHGRSPAELSIAWVLRHPAVTGAIVGARRPEQVEEILGAATFRLSLEEIAEIGLVD